MTLSARVAERIHADILSSKLEEGDLYMTSDQIVARYEVSRTVAREALSQLHALGVVKSRRRRGVLVSQPDPVKLSARWVPMFGRVAGEKGFHLLAQWRYVIELGAVDLAITHCKDEQIRRLGELANQFDAVASKKGHCPDADQVDMAFHAVILEMTGNPLVAGMHQVLADYFRVSPIFNRPPEASKAIREHHTIAEAFQRRDQETVRSILRSHLLPSTGD